MATGHVARFDPRRGYGFLIPDDGGEDVFVHQNNINMEGFRYLKPGEQVRYELEVSEKGLKAVDVALLEPRQDDEPDNRYDRQPPRRRSYDRRDSRRDDRGSGGGRVDDRLLDQVDKLRRKQERLISLLVEKGVLTPGEVDGLEGPTIPDEAPQPDGVPIENED